MDSMVEREGDGRLPVGTGLSQQAAEPEVSALRASIPDAGGFTEGPWHVLEAENHRRNRRIFTVFAAGEELKYIAYCDDGLYFYKPTDNRANAYLIAAAPEMLADLIEAERMFRWYGDLHAAKPDMEKAERNFEMADRLAATIAKAIPAQAMSAGTAKTAQPVEGEARQRGPKDAPASSSALSDTEGR